MSTAAPSPALLASSPPDKKRTKREGHSPADLENPADSTSTMAATLLCRPPPSSSNTSEEAFKTAIALTPHEEQLFGLLLGAAEGAGKGTVLRVAGGWVRDKLLGRESDDVDVALDNVSGQAFAELLKEHLRAQGIETRSVGVIQANPDRSKHLETARVMVLGQWVDFTNLRTETYSEVSRIPVMAFGTAKEDAFRRDFTINALFYNLGTRQVEDFTGQGLADLLGPAGVIHTPLPALTTFLDDPLRVLRAVRFGARFALPLHADIIAAARDPQLRTALATKVSRERIGMELEGMLSGKDARPALALEALAALGLAGTTFVPPQLPEEEEGEGEGVGWVSVGVAAVRLANLLLWRREGGEGDGWVEGVLAPEDADESGLGPDGGVEEGDAAQEASSRLLLGLTREKGYRRPRRGHRLLFMAAMLLGWAGRECPAAAAAAVVGGASKRPVPIVQLVVREALKLRGRDAEEVALLHAMLPRFRALVEGAGGGGGGGNVHRLEAGLLLREAKELWRVGMDLACVEEMVQRRLNKRVGAAAGAPHEETPAAVMDRYSATCARIEALGLEGVWQLKPLLDGKALIGALSLSKGPLVGKVMTEQIRWQIEHPEGSKERALEHLEAYVVATSGDRGGGDA